ncbi:MAG: hypothetical protein OHK0022_26480 [Roseiflexaceae bacterium]
MRQPGALGRWGLALLVVVALLAAWAVQQQVSAPRCTLGAEDDLGCARGFEERERDGGRPFRWTDGDAQIVLAGAGYAGPRIVELTLAAPRPPDAPPALLALSAGGPPAVLAAAPEPRRYRLLAAGPLDGDRIRVSISSDVFVPPDSDRALGALVYTARVLSASGPVWPGPLLVLALLGLGLSAALLAPHRPLLPTLLGLLAIGVGAALWALLPLRSAPYLPVLALIGAAAALLARRTPDLAPLGRFPVLAAIGGGALIDALIVAGAFGRGWFGPVLLAQAALPVAALWLLARGREQARIGLGGVLAVAMVVRLLGFAARLLAGRAASDLDTQLFYSYGAAALALGVPAIEYPSAALLPWMLLALPGSRELFTLLLPLLNLACDLLIVWGIWTLGRRQANAHPAALLALFYALSPLLLPFWHAKYDPLPAALLVVGLAAFAHGRTGWSGVALGLGGAIKWVPWLAAPLLFWQLLRERSIAATVRFLAGMLAAIALSSLPFALLDPVAFTLPYRLQGGRAMTGESIWFLPAVLIEPGLAASVRTPWGPLPGAPVAGWLMVAAQLLVLGGLWLIQTLGPASRSRALVGAALAPALFLLLNRVFSPQYMLIISACLLAAATIVVPRRPLVLLGLLALMQATNLLVWPNTVPYWLAASATVFVCGALAVGAVAWQGLRLRRQGALALGPWASRSQSGGQLE